MRELELRLEARLSRINDIDGNWDIVWSRQRSDIYYGTKRRVRNQDKDTERRKTNI